MIALRGTIGATLLLLAGVIAMIGVGILPNREAAELKEKANGRFKR